MASLGLEKAQLGFFSQSAANQKKSFAKMLSFRGKNTDRDDGKKHIEKLAVVQGYKKIELEINMIKVIKNKNLKKKLIGNVEKRKVNA